VVFDRVLAILAIVISAGTLAWTSHNDILHQQREQATEPRTAAALVLKEIERLPESSNELPGQNGELDQAIVKASSQMSDQKHDEQAARAARDYFWEKTDAAHLKWRERLMDTAVAYVALRRYITDAGTSSIEKLREAEARAFDNIRFYCERIILAMPHEVRYESAVLGNSCRAVMAEEYTTYLKTEKPIFENVKKFLEQISMMTDREIVSALKEKTFGQGICA
jgi:hypothetical protein